MALTLPQLTLDLFEGEHADFAEFVPGANAMALAAVTDWAAGAGPWCVFLWGRGGCGKSHLLHAAVRAVGREPARAMYVPLRDVDAAGPGILEGLDAVDFIVLDDIDRIIGDDAWEVALFDLFNRAQAAERRLLIGAAAAPAALQCGLPDLASRLQSALIFQLRDLTDGDKQVVLQRRARARGLALPDHVARYLINRLARDMGALNSVFERIDSASLSSGRELTIPFVRDVLGLD